MMRIGTEDDTTRYLARKTIQQKSFTRKHTWRMLWPTPKQAAIFSDRSLPKPPTRGEAADQIADIKQQEGWDQ